jgi:hypothetical protein
MGEGLGVRGYAAMTHPDEKTLELYVLDAMEVRDQRGEIEKHLRECAGCKALHQEISDYYAEVRALQHEAARANTEALTLRDWIVHARRFEDRTPMRPSRQSLALRAVVFAVRHPVVTSLSFLALLAAALLVSYPRKGPTDLNPSYARAKDEFLIAYNKAGQELWRRHFGFGYNYNERDANGPGTPPLNHLLSTIDVDGDGKNEVITLCWGSLTGSMPKTIYCFDPEGNERWKYEIHRTIKFGTQLFSDDFHFSQMIVGDFDHDGAVEIVAVAHHSPDFPCVVVRLDARSGKLLSEYWHPGYLRALGNKDIDGDGIEEIFLGGVNNAYEMGALVVFDPRSMSGHAPATARYIAQGVPKGSEKYYILFPRNDLSQVAVEKVGAVSEISFAADGLIRIGTGENMGDRVYGPMYYFDSRMRLIKLEPETGFEAVHRRLEAEGKLKRKLDERYYNELREGVRYWDGEKFVKEPTMNRQYVESASVAKLP